GHGELHLLALFKGAVAVGLDGGEVDEHVLPAFLRQEAVALAVVEPLDRSDDTLFRHGCCLLGAHERKDIQVPYVSSDRSNKKRPRRMPRAAVLRPTKTYWHPTRREYIMS